MMPPRVRQLFREEMGDVEPSLVVRTEERIDAGHWWRRNRIWLCVAGGDLVMLALGRRRYFAKLPIPECHESFYNHATGEFVVVPGAGLRFPQISIKPRDALQILKLLKPSEEKETIYR